MGFCCGFPAEVRLLTQSEVQAASSGLLSILGEKKSDSDQRGFRRKWEKMGREVMFGYHGMAAGRWGCSQQTCCFSKLTGAPGTVGNWWYPYGHNSTDHPTDSTHCEVSSPPCYRHGVGVLKESEFFLFWGSLLPWLLKDSVSVVLKPSRWTF